MKNAPGLKWNAEPDFVDTNMISLSASSSGQLGDLLITNFSVDITVGKITTNYKLDNLDLYFDDSNDSPYQIYWSNDTGSPLAGVADFTLVTKIALKGVVNVRSSMSDVFKTALAAKGADVDAIGSAIRAATAGDAMRKHLLSEGLEPIGSTPAEFTRFLQQEVERWRKTVTLTGAKAA